MSKKIPSFVYPSVWSALMGACQNSGFRVLQRMAPKQTTGLDEQSSVVYARVNVVMAGEMYHETKARNG